MPAAELPQLLGELEVIRATALMRLSAPTVQPCLADELIDIAEAGRRLGVSRSWLYHEHDNLPFARRNGRKLVYSAQGIEKYIKGRR
jgi:hypothetical protein